MPVEPGPGHPWVTTVNGGDGEKLVVSPSITPGDPSPGPSSEPSPGLCPCSALGRGAPPQEACPVCRGVSTSPEAVGDEASVAWGKWRRGLRRTHRLLFLLCWTPPRATAGLCTQLPSSAVLLPPHRRAGQWVPEGTAAGPSAVEGSRQPCADHRLEGPPFLVDAPLRTRILWKEGLAPLASSVSACGSPCPATGLLCSRL